MAREWESPVHVNKAEVASAVLCGIFYGVAFFAPRISALIIGGVTFIASLATEAEIYLRTRAREVVDEVEYRFTSYKK